MILIFGFIKIIKFNSYIYYRKYERCKAVIDDFKHNEDVLKETIKANEEAILKLCNKFETLKKHTMEQLDK